MTERQAVSAVAVPFLDLRPSHEALTPGLLREIGELIDSGAFTNGPQVEVFERAFAQFCGTRGCVGVASGLDALRLALASQGIGPEDEVLVPANTFVATFEAVSQVGARPVPVDASERDYNLDASRLEASISDRTRAVIPVHLYGQMADIRSVRDMATRHGFALLEDGCQAHGAVRDDLVAGAAGHAGAFSFYPGKNLGAFGDAGALVSDDETLIERVRALREHGQREKYRHELIGYTARLDTIQALVLLRKLPLLSQWNEQRRAAARLYDESLEGLGDIRLPPVPDGSSPVWHVYAVRTGRRDELAAFLREHAIGTGLHYPQPAHLSAAYRHLGYRRGEFPVTEALADELLSLPMFPGILESQVGAVVDAVGEFFRRG